MAAFAHNMAGSGFSSLAAPHLRDSSPWCKPKRIVMSMNQSYRICIDHAIQTHIGEVLLKSRGRDCVMQPMHHLAFAAPTRKCASLCVGACEMVGGRREDAITAASALHLMLSAALVHENLQLSESDQSELIVHHAFDTNIELQTGDALLPLGYQILAELGDSDDHALSERIVRVVIEISKAMGSQGMIEGHYMESRMGEKKWVYQVTEKKEGGIYACSAACGAILGGATEKEINQLRRYGFYLGMIDGMMTRGVGLLEQQKLDQLIQDYQCLALQELENFQHRNSDSILSLMDAYSPNNQTTRKPVCYV